jgi:hypothetical protein
MKNFLAFTFVFFATFLCKAQECTWDYLTILGTGSQLVDSNSFESNSGVCKILIDSTMPNNI